MRAMSKQDRNSHVPPSAFPDEPHTTLESLSFAEPDVASIEAWSSQLPLVNIEETTQQLAMAIAEVTILEAPPQQRFLLIESLRSLIHYIYTRSDRAQSGQQQSRNATQRNATPAQVLQSNLCRAYAYVFR